MYYRLREIVCSVLTDLLQWRKHNKGLPQAYYGTCVAGFPNFFIMMGPNTVNGHLSVIFSSECQINFALRMLDPILRTSQPSSWFSILNDKKAVVSAVEVTQDAETQENEWIQDRAKGLVWSSGCTNWYVEPTSGKNLMVYPDWQWRFWLRSFLIDQSNFIYTRQDGKPVKIGGVWQGLVAALVFLFSVIHLL